MEENGKIEVKDALLIFADRLDNIEIPISAIKGPAILKLANTLADTAEGLRECSKAMSAAIEKAKADQEVDAVTGADPKQPIFEDVSGEP